MCIRDSGCTLLCRCIDAKLLSRIRFYHYQALRMGDVRPTDHVHDKDIRGESMRK